MAASAGENIASTARIAAIEAFNIEKSLFTSFSVAALFVTHFRQQSRAARDADREVDEISRGRFDRQLWYRIKPRGQLAERWAL